MTYLEEFLKARVSALEKKQSELEQRVKELEDEKIKNINIIEFEQL